jgi:S1-C subfamily serine protease
MEDTLLIDAVERFVNGEMTPQEKIYFEDLRKNNPELDQAVVEQLFFLNELNNFGATKSFKHRLHETQQQLADEGFVFHSPVVGKAKLVQLWNKYRKTVAVAASIAGVVSLLIASVVSAVTKKDPTNTTLLVNKVDAVAVKNAQIERKLNKLEAAAQADAKKPMIASRFSGTGFLVDVNNNYIITNAHVAMEAKNQLIVENKKGDQFNAIAVYIDKERDIAILRIKDKTFKKLSPIPFQIRKTNAYLGEQIYMLGFPKQEIVYDEGYVSARNGHDMDTLYCQLSTTANAGSSGSPVITKNGDLIGVLTSKERNAQGVVYAIKSVNIIRAIEEARKIDEHSSIKITAASGLKGLRREDQIEKMEDYVFMIKGN